MSGGATKLSPAKRLNDLQGRHRRKWFNMMDQCFAVDDVPKPAA